MIYFHHLFKKYAVRSGLIFLMLSLFCLKSFGQRSTATSIPHFRIQQTNGKIYSYQQVEKNRPFILIYFSPDCGHCADFTAGLIKNAPVFKNKQMVMACWEPLQSLDTFQRKYDFSALPNLKIGSEGYTFLLQQNYQIHYFPFIAVFNKEGQLIKKLGNKAGMTDMAQLLDQLKAVSF